MCLLLLSRSLFPLGTPCPHWNWQGGIRMDETCSGLPSTARRRRGKWCRQSSHCLRRFLVLNPSIISIMTIGLSCGCFTPLASSSEKTMSVASLLWCFVGGIIWTLLTCLYCDFLRDLKDPPIVRPPLIILISPIAVFSPSHGLSSSLDFSSDLVWSSCFGRLYVFFLTNFCNFPF